MVKVIFSCFLSKLSVWHKAYYVVDPDVPAANVDATQISSEHLDGEDKINDGSLANAPIYVLSSSHINHIRQHILALNERDRYMRFGLQATDAQINNYVDQINFERDEVFGVCSKQGQLIGIAHLSFSKLIDSEQSTANSLAEFGVSVNKAARGLGLGSRLFAYSAKRATDRGINRMFIHTINKNVPMFKIIKRSGAEIFRDGSDVDAYLALPANNAWLNMRISAEVASLDSYGIEVELSGLRQNLLSKY